MIHRRKRPFPRRQFERELRQGPKTFLHEPANLAARDFVLHQINLNPFADGSDDANAYDEAYARVEKELTTRWKEEGRNDKPNPSHG